MIHFRKFAVATLRFLLMVILTTNLTTPAHGSVLGWFGDNRVSISGFGFFGNLYLQRALSILDPEDGPAELLDRTYIENAVWILAGEIQNRGYLKPVLEIRLFRDSVESFSTRWDNGFEERLPREIEVDYWEVSVTAGRLYYFDKIELTGLPANLGEHAAFFYATDRLFITKTDRFFTPGRMSSGFGHILQALRDQGHRRAHIVSQEFTKNDETGAVSVHAAFETGPVFYLRSVTFTRDGAVDGEGLPDTGEEETLPLGTRHLEDVILTPDLIMRYLQEIRTAYQHLGYPEVSVNLEEPATETLGDNVLVDLQFDAEPGNRITVGEIKFINTGGVSPRRLESQVPVDEGDLLDVDAVREGRDRLFRLSIFDAIDVGYEDVDEHTRNISYMFRPKPKNTVRLIFGIGSYDIVRGGFEWTQNNLWNQAHQGKLTAIQSLKATVGDYTYSIPQVTGLNLNVFANANYLRRENISFDREEYGGSAGVQHYLRRINTSLSAQFNYQLVEARNPDFIQAPGLERANVSSFEVKAMRNELDNPIYPTRGYQLFGSTEIALPQFGGNADYVRLIAGGAYHHPVARGLVWHAGLQHGVIAVPGGGGASTNIPVNKRFFLGGENTVRGYRRDQASPLNAQGQQIGATSYVLLQNELQQRITGNISFVVFADSVGLAADISEYPFNDILVSVGAGIRYRTIVGPLRFEYAYNVKRRPQDPRGMFQFALGAPF